MEKDGYTHVPIYLHDMHIEKDKRGKDQRRNVEERQRERGGIETEHGEQEGPKAEGTTEANRHKRQPP